METTEEILDRNLIQEELSNPDLKLAGSGKRLANMIIDLICYYALVFLLAFLIGALGFGSILRDQGVTYLLVFLTHFIYYSFFEAFLGKTVGKMITKTRVVDENGGEISFGQAVGRSLCRFIPFDVFSFLGQKGIGWHDSIPRTRVINDD